MYHTKLKPDFRRLEDYLPDLTNDTIASLEASEGVDCYLEYVDEAKFINLTEGLKTILERYNIQDHYLELLYIILQKNEQIRVRYDAYWQNYYDDLSSKEVANFLLAYRECKPNQYFQLVAKPVTGSVAVKDTVIARWMCEQIYKAIESQDFPIHIFGEKILYNLFGDEFGTGKPITNERLKATADLSPRKPTVRIKKLLVEFCIYIQVYLINHTSLTAPNDVRVTDAQSNFFFDVLELLKYLDREKIESEPKDYVNAMFRNQLT